MTNEELVIRIKAGVDVPENMLQLWQQAKAFIHTVALHYRGLADLEDLEQEGYLALYDAVDGFCPDMDCKFLTYAKYILHNQVKSHMLVHQLLDRVQYALLYTLHFCLLQYH